MTTFVAHDPRTGQLLATHEETAPAAVEAVLAAAAAAAGPLRRTPAAVRAGWLRALAERFAADGWPAVADAETALGTARLDAEWQRTIGQLRAFAAWIERPEVFADERAEADPTAVPPRAALRRIRVPIGPVVGFAASNFPFAFAVPGTDTASAIAAGCPLVVKGHPSHPATSATLAATIDEVLAAGGAPAGTFALVQGASESLGRRLVTDERVAVVVFTGSLRGGRALYDLAAQRRRPIPVYAEMGSVNPVFVTAAALDARGDAIASGFVASALASAGQYCTSPGVVVVPRGDAGDRFEAAVARELASASVHPLLNPAVVAGCNAAVERSLATGALRPIATADAPAGLGVAPQSYACDRAALLAHPELLDEHFGPVSLVVRADADEHVSIAELIEGSLTATLHAEPDDDVTELVDALIARVGRLVWNGFPTGVAISPAMHHGGPYPATTHPGFTSVGEHAIDRFLRPVTLQDVPAAVR